MPERLSEESEIIIRPIRPDDHDALSDAFDRLSYQSIVNRFFQCKNYLTEAEVDYFTHPDFVRHVALVAELPHSKGGELIASVRYFVDPETTDRAEVVATVIDEYQRRGIGSRMIRLLSEIAKNNGVRQFFGTALIENEPVNRMLQSVASSLEIKDHPSIREFCIDLKNIHN